MAIRIVLTLTSAVFIQAVCGLWLKFTYTGKLGSDINITNASQPVAFPVAITDIKYKNKSLYDQATRTISVPGDGQYWITLTLMPMRGWNSELRLYINGRDSKFGVWAEGYRSSQSAAFLLRARDRLTVMAGGGSRMQQSTFWSVAYIGYYGQAFTARVSNRTADTPVPFDNRITVNRIFQDPVTRLFTVRADSICLVSLSTDGEFGQHLVLWLDAQYPGSTNWTNLLDSHGYYGASHSTTGIFNFRTGTKLRVRRNTAWGATHAGPKSMFSIVGIGQDIFDDTIAFMGETAFYARRGNDPVKFSSIRTNVSVLNSTAPVGTFYVPFDSIYVISLRPRTFFVRSRDEQSLTLKNKTDHTLLYAATERRVPSGIATALHLRAGDELKVFAGFKVVRHGNLFSIANLGLCCNAG